MHDKDGKDEQCEFVKNTEDCQNEEGLLEYNHFIYCTLGGDLIPLAAVILVSAIPIIKKTCGGGKV